MRDEIGGPPKKKSKNSDGSASRKRRADLGEVYKNAEKKKCRSELGMFLFDSYMQACM